MTAQLTATTGMDALTHAIEAYVSTLNGPFTDSLALQAIEMVLDYLPASIGEPPPIDTIQSGSNALMASAPFKLSQLTDPVLRLQTTALPFPLLINNRNGKATEVTTRSYITTAE